MKEAIILAGGLGTRLRSVVPDLPKCMAPVNNKPFLTYVIHHLLQQGVDHFIFSLGYLSQPIVDFLLESFPTLHFSLSLEDEPLGTGGAIRQALTFAESKDVLVTNGDTLFKVDMEELFNFHEIKQAECTLCLKPMHNFDRYGVVETDTENRIISFREKQRYDEGVINGGVYLIDKMRYLQENLPVKFSFEKDYLEKLFAVRKFYGMNQNEYFIDIGIPEDFQKAQLELTDGAFQ